MVRAITILFVLLTTSFVQAQALVLRTVEKRCTPNGCEKITGTGTCVFVGHLEDRSVYVTAAHNLRGNPAVYVGHGGLWWQSRTAYQEYREGVDYAIIETQKINSTKCFQFASTQPVHEANATAFGYSNGIYNLKVLRAKIRVNRNGRFFSKIVAKGDSGGPIVVNNQVVGIINGHDYKQTIYTDSVLIRRRLISLYGRLPDCRCRPPIIVNEEPPKPEPSDNSEQLVALEGKLSKLREQLEQLRKTKIPVQIIGKDDKVLSEQTYPLGSPIKLRFKAVEK